MSDNERSPLPTGLAKQRRNDKQRRKAGLGIRRTRSLLNNALVAFMQEKSIDKITVQEVLDRATVSRSTFYLHYCDKDDLILCVLEEGLEMWSATLLRKQEKSYRIAPVAEFVMHVGDAKKLYRALVDSGRIQAFFELAQGYFARSIARHLKDVGLKHLVQSELDARSQCTRRKPAVTSEMVARSRRQRVTKSNRRTIPSDGVERTAIQIQITVDNPGGR